MTDPAAAAADDTYLARVQVRRTGGPDKSVLLPGETEPVTMGSHPELAPHIGADPAHPAHASTLDYVVGAAAACLAGTFARALAARGITLALDDHEVLAEGELRKRDGVLAIERIRVTHRVRLDPAHQAEAERVLGFYERGCPVSRSIGGSIAIESQLELI